MKEELKYWEIRCKLSERYIANSPCDPDIYRWQYAAYVKWKKQVEQPIPQNNFDKLIKQTPNDTDLGKLIRERYGNTK